MDRQELKIFVANILKELDSNHAPSIQNLLLEHLLFNPSL